MAHFDRDKIGYHCCSLLCCVCAVTTLGQMIISMLQFESHTAVGCVDHSVIISMLQFESPIAVGRVDHSVIKNRNMVPSISETGSGKKMGRHLLSWAHEIELFSISGHI